MEGETLHTSYGSVVRDSQIPPIFRPLLPTIINMAGKYDIPSSYLPHPYCIHSVMRVL